ncbi:hypothetical protein FQA39_LY18566 [Lamprigera yunnana]|nr:hypothetical protein FQA39_LY18566 [Lamprigera yunnana]
MPPAAAPTTGDLCMTDRPWLAAYPADMPQDILDRANCPPCATAETSFHPVRRPHGAALHGRHVQLPPARPVQRGAGGLSANPALGQGRPRGADDAQRAAVRDSGGGGAARGAGGGQCQPAVHIGRSWEHNSKDQAGAKVHDRAGELWRHAHGRYAGLSQRQHRQLGGAPQQKAGARVHARQIHPLQRRRARRRAPHLRPGRDWPARHGRAAIHRRHHGRSQGCRAAAPQPGRQCGAGAGLVRACDQNHSSRRAAAVRMRAAALPYLCVHGVPAGVHAPGPPGAADPQPARHEGGAGRAGQVPIPHPARRQHLVQRPDEPRRFDKVNWKNLRVVVGGGAAVQQAVAERWLQRTGQPIVEGYGLSETSPVASCNIVGTGQVASGSIGYPLPGTDLAILDDDGHAVAQGERGEVCIRGPQVMAGYWQRPDETAKAMTEDGYFRSGDIGIMEADGLFRIVDRKKDMVLVSGFNVYPNEVEDVVAACPGVLECAVVGVPDEKTGEAIKLVVVATPTLTKKKLRAFCLPERRLDRLQTAQHIGVSADGLPKSRGKILRRGAARESKG